MIFCAVSTIHSHLTQDQRLNGFARRAEWKYPAGVKVVHEVWRTTAPEIVSTFECDTYEPIMAIQLAWADFMQMNVSPCTTPDEGLKTGAKLLSAMHQNK
jgi:hypothetical protein